VHFVDASQVHQTKDLSFGGFPGGTQNHLKLDHFSTKTHGDFGIYMDPPFSDSSAGRPLAAKGQQRLSGERPVVEKLPEMMGHLTDSTTDVSLLRLAVRSSQSSNLDPPHRIRRFTGEAHGFLMVFLVLCPLKTKH
jgi:hypothetical protein